MKTMICIDCKEEVERTSNRQKRCVECRRKRYVKLATDYIKRNMSNPEFRLKRRKYEKTSEQRTRKKYPKRYKARCALREAVRSGKIAKLPCSVCGAKLVEAHHENYNKPLEVIWFCRKHHVEYHKKTFAFN